DRGDGRDHGGADAAAVRREALRRVRMKRPRGRQLARNEERRAQTEQRPEGQDQRRREKRGRGVAALPREREENHREANREVDGDGRLLRAVSDDRRQQKVGYGPGQPVGTAQETSQEPADAGVAERAREARRRERLPKLPAESEHRRGRGGG